MDTNPNVTGLPGAGASTNPALSAEHLALLQASAITPEVAAERGYRTLDAEEAAAELPALGFQAKLGAGLLIPLWDVYGTNGAYQFRPDRPRLKDGKPIKYESPPGSRPILDVPPRMRAHLGDPAITHVYTEGAKKADALASAGFLAIDVSGVWNWLAGGKALGDFDGYTLRETDSMLVFDSDARSNSNVRLALERLGQYLRSRGAKVRVVLPPGGPGGEKQGIDDYLADGGDFAALCATAAPVEDGGELFDSWIPINLATLGERAPVLPDLAPKLPIFYPAKRHVISGLPESLKTLLTYAALLDALRHDKRVGVINFEMDEFDARDMFRDLGATDEEIEQIVFRSPERKPTAKDIAAVVEQQLDVVLIDAGAGMYQLEDVDDNKRGEVEKAAKKWITPLWKAGAATWLLDHQAKTRAGSWAIGSERKVGQADVHLRLDARKKLVRGSAGVIRVFIEKDRPGYIRREMPHGFEVHVFSEATTNALTYAIKAIEEQDADSFRPTGLMEKASRYVEEHEGKSKNEVSKAVGGRKEYAVKAIDVLQDEGYIDVVTEGQKHVVAHLKPYREMDEVLFGSAPEEVEPEKPRRAAKTMSVPEDF